MPYPFWATVETRWFGPAASVDRTFETNKNTRIIIIINYFQLIVYNIIFH